MPGGVRTDFCINPSSTVTEPEMKPSTLPAQSLPLLSPPLAPPHQSTSTTTNPLEAPASSSKPQSHVIPPQDPPITISDVGNYFLAHASKLPQLPQTKKSGSLHDVDQFLLIENLQKYVAHTGQKPDPPISRDGYCHALSYLELYCRSIDAGEIYDNMLRLIVSLNVLILPQPPDQPSPQQKIQIESIEAFFNALQWIQSGEDLLKGSLQLNLSNDPNYQVVSTHILCDNIENISMRIASLLPKPGMILTLSTGQHIMNAYRGRDGEIYFSDTNLALASYALNATKKSLVWRMFHKKKKSQGKSVPQILGQYANGEKSLTAVARVYRHAPKTEKTTKEQTSQVILEISDASLSNKAGYTPLHHAVLTGDIDAIRGVLMLNVDTNAQRTADGASALHLATQLGNKEAVEALLGSGADKRPKNHLGSTPLHLAAQDGDEVLVEILLDKQNVNDMRNDGGTALHLAAQGGHHNIVNLLLRKGANLEAKSQEGWTPLQIAASAGNTEIMRTLLIHGAKPNVEPSVESPAESQQTQFSTIEAMLQRYLKNAADSSKTPLHLAAENAHTETMQVLLEHGAHIDAVNKEGWTPLHLAVSKGNIAAVELLLARGARMDVANKEGQTALDIAAAPAHGHAEIIELLKKHAMSQNV